MLNFYLFDIFMKKTVKTKECVIKKFFKTKKNLPMIGIGGLILAFAVYALAAPSAFKGIADNMFGSTMQLRSYTTNWFIYEMAEVDCMDNTNIDLEEPCSNNMAEVDWMEEAVDICEAHNGVENLSFYEGDRCETEIEFNCTDDEVLDAAEEFESDFYGFMDWIDDYMDECELENNHYDWIEVECENGEEIDIDYTNADCDDYEQWMREAFLTCDTAARDHITDFDFYGFGCNVAPAGDCTNEELLECITAPDYDACIAECSGEELEYGCTEDEIIEAFYDYRNSSPDFTNRVRNYLDECNLEDEQYDAIDVDCDNGDHQSFDITPSGGDCDEYEEWLVKARDYCEENDSYVNSIEMEWHNCGWNNIDPLLQKMEALKSIRKR